MFHTNRSNFQGNGSSKRGYKTRLKYIVYYPDKDSDNNESSKSDANTSNTTENNIKTQNDNTSNNANQSKLSITHNHSLSHINTRKPQTFRIVTPPYNGIDINLSNDNQTNVPQLCIDHCDNQTVTILPMEKKQFNIFYILSFFLIICSSILIFLSLYSS